VESQVRDLLESRESKRRRLEAEKAKTREIIETKIIPVKTKTQRESASHKGAKKGLPSVKLMPREKMKDLKKKETDTLSMGYDRFLEFMPSDTWKYLPHTFAAHMSDGAWLSYDYLVMLSNIIVTAVTQGGGRILVSLPPRHGKSSFLSQWLPFWFLSMWPQKRVILTTYEANFAATWGRKVRNLVQEKGPEVGVHLAPDATASNNWATFMEGGMMTAGVGGPITGKGGDLLLCFPAETLIKTEIGDIKISELYKMETPPLVLTYDHSMNKLVYRKITWKREIDANEFIELETTGGHRIRSTREHRIYDCERGYKEAKDFLSGDRVLVHKKVTETQILCDMRKAGGPVADAPGVLQQGSENDGSLEVHPLRDRIQKTALRIRKTIKSWTGRFLLFSGLQQETPRHQTFSALSCMRETGQERPEVLLEGMPADRRPKKKTAGQILRLLRDGISRKFKQNNVLQQAMPERCPFGSHEGPGQLPLQNGYVLCQAVSGDEEIYCKAGSRCLLWMREEEFPETGRPRPAENGSCCASHQRGSDGQPSREPGDALFDLSLHPSSLQSDTISGISRIRKNREPVYDIRVEGTHNFFADGLLVHNCDDPHKNWQEAQSPTIRKTIKDWFDSTFYTRLEPGGTIIVLHTRWHEDDLIGYLMREKPEDGWFHLRIPAIAEDWNNEEDPLGRKVGAALCPQRYDEKALNRIKANMTPMMWNALFQQRPAPMEGSIFLRKNWKYYSVLPKCGFVIQSWDTASKKNWDSAYSVCQTWGVSDLGAVLIDQWRDKVEYPQLLRQAEIQYLKYRPNAVLIEDRDSGQALIQSLQQNTTMPILPIYPDMDKVVRAQAVSPWHEAGRVWVPDPVKTENLWVADLIENAATFPNAVFKDEIDSMSQALAYIMTMAMGGRILSCEKRRTSKLLEGYRSMM
jgi:predicted phage terminase large subunit-like protein